MVTVLKEVLEKMSSDELRELLKQDLDSGGDLGGATIIAITEVLKERGELDDAADSFPDADAMWADFRKNYMPGKLSSAPASKRRLSFNRVLRAASIALVAVLTTAVVSVSARAAGYDIWGAVAKWTSERFSFSGHINESPEPTLVEPAADDEYETLGEALEAYGITESVAPKWLPSGYELVELDINRWASEQTNFYAEYQNHRSVPISITITRHLSSDPDYAIHKKDNGEVTVYSKNGIEHYIMTSLGRRSVTWLNGFCECTIRGDLSVEEVETIIDSIYE